ncbi:unnamed protein product [Echinostoma caproni]|uniref:TORC_M domain-containing protein n=1 Tax=Echinostoma caproni TaxID=27848 RepID=A0A183AKI0_9TREM|nr:unnamed protein product [Echinostoma caproni]
MIASSPVRNDLNLMCPSSGIDIQQVPGAPYWKPPTEMPSRPGSQCNSGGPMGNNGLNNAGANSILFQPNSPYNPMKSKLSRPQTATSACTTTSTSSTSANSLSITDPSMSSYPGPVGSLIGGSSNPLLPPFNGMNTNSTLNMLPPVDQPPCPSGSAVPLSTASTDRGARFGLVLPNPQHGLNMLQQGFLEEPTIPAFQQLMSNFDTTDTAQGLSVPTASILQTSSMYSNPHDFPKTPSTCADGLLLSPTISNQIPPNVSIPSRGDFTMSNNSKLDSLLGAGGHGIMPSSSNFANQVTSSSTNGLALFAPQLSNSNHSPLRAPSPTPFNLNLLSNTAPPTGFAGSGSYLHPGLSQAPLGASSRAPLST